MILLDKLQYLQMLGPPVEQLSPEGDTIDRVLNYATGVWPQLQLKPRQFAPKDLASSYRHGASGCAFFHIKAFPRRMADTFAIVAADPQGRKVRGHILIDLAAEYAAPFLDCPAFDIAATPTEAKLRYYVENLDPLGAYPFAVLSRGEGTYMQTLRTQDGYVLEHQLVNTSSHYEIPEPTTVQQAADALVSFAFGNNEWLESFSWRHQKLN